MKSIGYTGENLTNLDGVWRSPGNIQLRSRRGRRKHQHVHGRVGVSRKNITASLEQDILPKCFQIWLITSHSLEDIAILLDSAWLLSMVGAQVFMDCQVCRHSDSIRLLDVTRRLMPSTCNDSGYLLYRAADFGCQGHAACPTTEPYYLTPEARSFTRGASLDS